MSSKERKQIAYERMNLISNFKAKSGQKHRVASEEDFANTVCKIFLDQVSMSCF